MQDRFRFRYYDEKSKKMYDVCFIDFNCPCVSVFLSKEELLHIGSRNFKWENLIQCTGLKDKNGKLIYEGDIVKQNKTLYIVNWENGSFCFKDTLNEKNYTVEFVMSEKQEVIGNIYENKELFNEK